MVMSTELNGKQGQKVLDLRGLADGFLMDGITRLIKKEAESDMKDDGSQEYHPQADPDRQFLAYIC